MSHDVACPFCGCGIPCGTEETQRSVAAAITSERSSIEMAKNLTRRPVEPRQKWVADCSVSGHHEYWEGKFHGFFNHPKGPVGIVENERGQLQTVEVYKIEFSTIATKYQ